MSFEDRIDPELRVGLERLSRVLPNGWVGLDVDARRSLYAAALAAALANAPVNDAVTWQDHTIPGRAGSPEVSVRVYTPTGELGRRPGLLHVHGGGMWLGGLDAEHLVALTLSEQVDAVVVSVDYRLAPEHPYPAPVQDCYATLCWIADTAGDLGIDPDRLALYGGSAGGGLIISTALLVRDRGGPALRLLMAMYPMIDDRNETSSSHEFVDLGPVWDRRDNIEGWKWFLGRHEPDQYAVPARAGDLRGLPPTFIDVGELDLFRDENFAFAVRLLQAGVPTEFHVYPGVFHGAESLAPQADVSRRIGDTRFAALRRALHPAHREDVS